jgi:histidyl-tRNA synthetase
LAGAQDKAAAARVLDKWNKLKPDDLSARLDGLDISKRGQKAISDFMSASNLDDLKAAVPGIEESDSYIYIEGIMSKLIELGYGNVNFDPSIIRGFDYYDGLIFEVFDNHPDNNRAMFGGGRYNGLAELFGTGKIPAVGFAPGDETTRLFLESWGMLDNAKSEREPKYYLPILDGSLSDETVRLSSRLRREGKSVSMGLEEQKLGKALEFASKNTFDYLVIFGKDEALSGIFKIKDMQSGLEKKVNL